MKERQKISESNEDPFELIKDLSLKNIELEENLNIAQNDSQEADSKIGSLKDSLRLSQCEHAKAREMIAFMEVSLSKQDGSLESTRSLEDLQKVWEVLGVDMSFRDTERQAIHSSLTDTCSRKLNDALLLKANSEKEIDSLTNQLDCMYKALGDTADLFNQRILPTPLLARLQTLQEEYRKLATPYKYACARRETILNDAIYLSEELGLSSNNLPSNLKTLLEQDETESEDNSDGSIESMTSGDSKDIKEEKSQDTLLMLPPNSLEGKFLADCEKEIKILRVQKSELLVQNREMLQRISEIVGELHMSTDEIITKIELYFKATQQSTHHTIDRQVSERILQDIKSSSINGESKASDIAQITLIQEALEKIAKHRQSLSSMLQTIIERAQKTLLRIVGDEVDASKAYANFHDALFQLPSLSRERSQACISEMEALVVGVEAMTQSETEALTVVWDALNISSEDRRNFWAQVGNPKLTEGETSNTSNEVEDCLSIGCEEWIIEATKRGEEIYKELDWKLSKLEEIHTEVEELRSKQDAKSQILSLDSEIRILNSKLLEFEAQKCGKGRLLTKKGNSSTLLKEERFRKQMQSKFVSQLGQLAELLQTWEKKEGNSFDASLLSDDVRMLLKEPNKMGDWVEKRTQCMHLRTVQTKQQPMKRPPQDTANNHRTLHQPKRINSVSGRSRVQEKSKIRDQNSTKENEASSGRVSSKTKTSTKVQNSNHKRKSDESHDSTTSDKRGPRKVRRGDNSALRPFGRILSDVGSPSHNASDRK